MMSSSHAVYKMDMASGSLENQALVGSEAEDPDATFNSDSVTTPVTDLADLRLTKTTSAASVAAGRQLTYTLTITNDGPSLATGVRVCWSRQRASMMLRAIPAQTPSQISANV